MSVTREGQTITNGTQVEQLVTLRHGDRWMRLLLAPGESRSCGDMPETAGLTSSTDTSSARGKFTLIGGPGGQTGGGGAAVVEPGRPGSSG